MNFTEVCKLIANRSEKLRSLREQAINGNEYILVHLVKRKNCLSQPSCICFKT